MIGNILFGLLVIISIIKFYKNRATFKQLSKKEWLQFIYGFLVAWIVAIVVIIGGKNIIDLIQITWLNKLLAILLILIGLTLAGLIMNLMPIFTACIAYFWLKESWTVYHSMGTGVILMGIFLAQYVPKKKTD